MLSRKYLHYLVDLHPDDVGRHADEVDDDKGSHEHHVPQLVPQVRVVEEEGGVRGKLGLFRGSGILKSNLAASPFAHSFHDDQSRVSFRCPRRSSQRI